MLMRRPGLLYGHRSLAMMGGSNQLYATRPKTIIGTRTTITKLERSCVYQANAHFRVDRLC
jgi:hypothetical protein